MKRYFELDSSPIYPEKYVVRVNPEGFPFPNKITGSLGLLFPRLMNMDYITYLRYVRDVLGAEVHGKRSRYMSVYFDYTPDVKSFVKLLNARMNYVMNEQQYPFEYRKTEDGEIERIPFNMNESNS